MTRTTSTALRRCPARLQGNPAVNVGGVGNSGDVRQVAVSENAANSGVAQHGSGRGGGQYAVQGGGLLGLDLQLAPAVTIGGILNSGDVRQTAVTENSTNSGVAQHR